MASGEGFEYADSGFLALGDGLLPRYNQSIADMVCRYGAGAHDVMDFGAGLGQLTLKVQAGGLTPLCLEPDAKQRAQLERLGFRTVGALDDVPAASLDYIYSSNVLEHIEDDVAALVDLRSKLRPGGRLFLYVPAFQSLFSAMDRAVGHHRRYDRTMLGDKLRAAGFAVEDLYYADVLGYFVTRLFRMAGDDTATINPFTMRVYDSVVFPVGRAIERLGRMPVGKNIAGVARNG